jgi:transcriptional regulator with XRE-family HTH domain
VSKEEAIQLRLAGLSRSQIADALGLKSGGEALSRWLRGIPPPEWTRRPTAKDHLREQAIELRREGKSYREIREQLGVAKSTLSAWLRDIDLSDEQAAGVAAMKSSARSTAGRTMQARRLAAEHHAIEAARGQVTHLAQSELFVAGLAAYWAEGTKSKPWNPKQRVTFINSDVTMIRLFLAWLELLGHGVDDLIFRILIHESADIAVARRFWTEIVGAPVEAVTLKRHNPKTVRKNTGDDYHGCLVVHVRRSTELYRRIAGWWLGIADSLGGCQSGVV